MRGIDLLQRGGVGLGILLVLGGIGLKWGLFPIVVQQMIINQIKLSPDNTEIWDTWIEPTQDLPVYMKFTFFNVSNPEEIKRGEKPIVQELGPFTYRETRRKTGVSSMEDTITYGSYISYELDENESCAICKQDTPVTVINPALAGIISMIDALKDEIPPELDPATLIPAFLGSLNQAINGEFDTDEVHFKDDLFTTETADKLIYTGYTPGVLTAVLYLIDALNLGSLIEIPEIIADGSFAFFKGNNGTADGGWYKINSGLYDMSKYQRILEYNGQETLPDTWWGTLAPTPSAHRSGVKGQCLELAGSDGTQYPPFVDESNPLWLFSSDLCRSIYLTYFEEVDMDGVTTKQFRVTPEVLSFQNSDNACFCQGIEECVIDLTDTGVDAWDFSNCTECYDGMLNLIGCQGAPVVISLPHFMDADASFVDAIQGLKPDPSLHTTYLNIEPMTGVALDAHKRIQVNIPMLPNEYLDVLNNVKETVFPVVWVDEMATLDGEMLDDLKAKLVAPFTAVDIGVGFMIGVGALLVILISILSLDAVKCCGRNRLLPYILAIQQSHKTSL